MYRYGSIFLMAIKIFVLGNPGSGKSTVSRFIVDYVLRQHPYWTANHVNDYGHLRKMFETEKEGKRFRPTRKHGGFVVLDTDVYYEALEKLEEQVLELDTIPDKLIVIEFARNNYRKALRQFSPDFLRDSYFVFLDVDIETCMDRIAMRIAHRETKDDYFVSSYVFKKYHSLKDTRQYVSLTLKTDYELAKERVKVIVNQNTKEEFEKPIQDFINLIFKKTTGTVIVANLP
jgi:adenylate kinase family enzyme